MEELDIESFAENDMLSLLANKKNNDIIRIQPANIPQESYILHNLDVNTRNEIMYKAYNKAVKLVAKHDKTQQEYEEEIMKESNKFLLVELSKLDT